MTTTFTIFDLFSLICGLAIFLYGMQQGEKNLKRLGGSSLRKIISAITRHRISAYFTGLFTTLLTQSSSATTVMLVGLASARLLTLGQSLGLILGSDLGTTFTVQLFAFKFQQIAPLLIGIGYFGTLTRKHINVSLYSKLILAFGFIFFGMELMSQSVKPLMSFPLFEQLMHASLTNPWYGLLVGTLFTAIIQSSAATLALLIVIGQSYGTGAAGGWHPTGMEFFPLILGANLGTCATAFLSTIRAEIEGVRVAWAHFTFKVVGTLVVFPFISLIGGTGLLTQGPIAIQIAGIHTFFNIFISILFLPFLGFIEKGIYLFIKEKKGNGKQFKVEFLHENVLALPLLALSQSVKEISRMSELVAGMLDQSYALINKFNNRTSYNIAQIDNNVDFLHEQIVTFLTRMAREELDPEQASRAYELIMVTTDIEHIGDIVSKSILTFADKIEASPLPLSPEGREEILKFYGITVQLYKEVIAAFTFSDSGIAKKIFNRKQEIKDLFEQLLDRHMNRLYKRKPESLQTTSIHIDLLEEIQRINHFTFRIAAHMLEIHKAE